MPRSTKEPGFVVVGADPFNGGPPLERLVERRITGLNSFFVRSHGGIPRVNASRWRLEVKGLVETPLELSLRDLKQRFRRRRLEATLHCAGNRRNELVEVAPIPGELRWGANGVSNAVWGGARLREVLEAAGPKRAARHAWFAGLDRVRTRGSAGPFGSSLSMAKATSDEVLLAYEMNGRPLSPIHGFPVRLVVPGYIGARSVKWLGSVELAARPSTNYFQAVSYKRIPKGAARSQAAGRPSLTEGVLNCVICKPGQGARVSRGPVKVAGYAVAGGGRTVRRVEVSGDGGRTWAAAHLLGRPSLWAWRLWEARVRIAEGSSVLVARAFDSQGHGQPASLQRVWNARGYVNNAWHRVRVEATAKRP